MAVFSAIAAAVTIFAVDVVGIGFAAGILAGSVVSGLASTLVLGAVSRALTPKPKSPGTLSVQARDRTLSVRQPITARRIVYGQAKIGGPILFIHSTNNNADLHLIVALASHEVAEIGEIYFNDELVPVASDGTVTGRYAGKAFVYKHLGAAGQAADTNLTAAAPDKWTVDHKLSGIAYIYVKLVFDQDLFGATGIPNISAIVKGRKIYDPRTVSTVWSDNPALILSDYLTDAKFGLAAVYVGEIDETALIAAANACDEYVTLAARDVTVT